MPYSRYLLIVIPKKISYTREPWCRSVAAFTSGYKRMFPHPEQESDGLSGTSGQAMVRGAA